MVCKKCGSSTEENAVFCGVCGARVDGKKPCGACGYLNVDTNAFCVQCGSRIDGKKVCSCGTAYEGNFCPSCGKGGQKAETKKIALHKGNKGVNEDGTWARVCRILKLIGGGAVMTAVLFSLIFVFCIGFKAVTGGESLTIYDYFYQGFKDIADIGKTIQDSTFRSFYDTAGYTYASVGLVGVVATLGSVITFSTLAIVRYVKGWLGKTDKRATKWCVATFISYATGVAFLYALNIAEINYYTAGVGARLGQLVEMTGATKAGLLLGIIFLAIGLLCFIVANFRKENIVKYAFAVGLTALASVIFCMVKNAGVSMEFGEDGETLIYVSANPLAFLMGFIAGTGVPNDKTVAIYDTFFLQANIYTILFQAFAILMLVFMAIALCKTLRTFYGNGKFAIVGWIISIIGSIGLLVTTVLLRGAMLTLIEDLGRELEVSVYFGWCIVLIVLSVVGLVASIVGNKLTKNKVE